MSSRKTASREPAWLPVDSYTKRLVAAAKACAEGVASEPQQKMLMDWIIRDAAGYYEISFRSDRDGGDRETSFAEGRRFVGQQLVKLINMPGKAVEALND